MNFSFATESEISQELGKRIHSKRLKKDLSQDQLATMAGIGVSTLIRMEKGQPSTLPNFIKVIIALGMVGDLEKLLVEDEITIDQFMAMNTSPTKKRARTIRKRAAL
ncbi:MAG: helix-turn-helix transcriptional regulator [Gammaproteobacteria bacterium]|nr:helix-turn-helix transcriptional regulator [Gammaproteobacteria bacterium]